MTSETIRIPTAFNNHVVPQDRVRRTVCDVTAPSRSDDGPGIDPEARTDALDVVHDVLAWRLVDERWQRVAQSLDAMATAVAAQDTAGVESATAELELASPVRVTRIGATSVNPPPEIVRDRVNHLVHSLRRPTELGSSVNPHAHDPRPAIGSIPTRTCTDRED
jgi:hypothetical protein